MVAKEIVWHPIEGGRHWRYLHHHHHHIEICIITAIRIKRIAISIRRQSCMDCPRSEGLCSDSVTTQRCERNRNATE